MRNRRVNNKSNNNINYIIIVIIVIITIIYLMFGLSSEKKEISDGRTSNTNSIDNKGLIVDFTSLNTEAEIIEKSTKKHKLVTGGKVFPGESIIIKSGDVSFDIPNLASYYLNINGKVLYSDDGSLNLKSSSLWVNSINENNVGMRYAKVNIGKNSVVNLNQNEVSSTIYLLKGTVKVTTLAGKTTFLFPGKKITISSTNASKKDLDINLLKEDFGDFFVISDWYIKNTNGNLDLTGTGTGTGTGDILTSTGSEKEKEHKNIIGLLSFNNIEDEGTIDSSSTNISGIFADERISEIIINNKKALINKKNKTFDVEGIDTSKKSNDLKIKIFDDNQNILGKYLYTVYYSKGDKNKINNNKVYSKINTESYPVNDSDFVITIPTVKNGETYSDENTFYGKVNNPNVASITVNGYKLKTYNGKIFRYHAFTKWNTLGEGVNNYEIKYLDINGKVILKKYITIDKKTKNKAVTPSRIISQEAKIQ